MGWFALNITAISVLFAPEALLSAFEVVVRALAALPTALREVEVRGLVLAPLGWLDLSFLS